MGFIPFMLPIITSSRGGGDIDGRERCKCCGQVMPKDRRLLKLVMNTFPGLIGVAIGTFGVMVFIVATLLDWVSGGNSFNDDIIGHAGRTLAACTWQNLLWLWGLLHHVL